MRGGVRCHHEKPFATVDRLEDDDVSGWSGGFVVDRLTVWCAVNFGAGGAVVFCGRAVAINAREGVMEDGIALRLGSEKGEVCPHDWAAGLEAKFARFLTRLVVEGGFRKSAAMPAFSAASIRARSWLGGGLRASLAAPGEAVGDQDALDDPGPAIGGWDELREDARGLWVKGPALDRYWHGTRGAACCRGGAYYGLVRRSLSHPGVRAKNDAAPNVCCRRLGSVGVSLGCTFPMPPHRAGLRRRDSRGFCLVCCADMCCARAMQVLS